jgi:transposase
MLTLPMCILVDSAVAKVQEVMVEEEPAAIVLTMVSTPATATCPLCGQLADRVHSRYQRRLADVSWALVPVRIVLQVRRFFCNRPDCSRRIFTERLPTIVQPYARRTARLLRLQQQLGVLLGGSTGAVVGTLLGLPGDIDLLLTFARQCPLPAFPTPRVLGIDDWAIRKGQRYGTILVDHERGHVIDLLPDRTPESVSHWLRDHPGVEIVTRDRAEAYAQAISDGAPDAVQVADRWHLLKNLTDALTAVLQDHRAAITQQLEPTGALAAEGAQASTLNSSAAPGAAAPTKECIPEVAPTAADRRRQARAEEAHQLHAQGWSQKAIAAHLDCHPKTIHRYLQRALPLSARGGARASKLEPYKPYLLERWNAGCHNASQLLREIEPRGYNGGCSILRSFVATLRLQSGMPARSRTAASQPLSTKAIQRVPSSRELAWLSTQPIINLTDAQKGFRAKLVTINDTVTTAVELGQQFATMVRERQAATLEQWLDRAVQSGIKTLRSLANGLRADLKAVRAGLRVEWSNGRTEGNVNRLKCVKRQMYGRGKLDLLRLRLIGI